MIPLRLNNKKMNKEEISLEIQKICKEHHENKTAHLFCILLYDINDGNVCRVIDDKHYWKSLNKISGKTISVLYLPTAYNDQGRDGFNNSIEALFEIQNPEKKSNIIIFQVDIEGIITEDYIYSIKENNFEEIYLEISELLKEIVASQQYITVENMGNYQELFDLAINNVKTFRIKSFFKRTFPIAMNITGFIAALKSF